MAAVELLLTNSWLQSCWQPELLIIIPALQQQSGLLLETEAPVMTPDSTKFPFFLLFFCKYVVLACEDDAVQLLMWRLRHGEGLAADGPQIAVIMIGGADLAYASFKVCLFSRQ